MPAWFSKPKKSQYRLLFATDVHGSEPTFRKFLNAGKVYGVDGLVLGGDISGKRLVPIIDQGQAGYTATLQGTLHKIIRGELSAFEERVAKLGFYSSTMSMEEYNHYSTHADEVEKLYLEKVAQRLTAWIRLAEERLAGTSIRCFVTGGNDDHQQVVDVLKSEAREHVVACEDAVVSLNEEYQMANLGYSNPTPWKTPREISEEELAARIDVLFAQVKDPATAIFNVHVPPVDSTLDTCPMLDTSTDPPTMITSGGEPVMFGAGSQAVKAAIEKYQPLLSLHGHIHESRNVVKIGRTTAINPGSEYGEGILRGAIINLGGGKVISAQLTSG